MSELGRTMRAGCRQRPTPRVQILFNGSQCRPISAACGCSEFQSRPLGPSRTWPGPQYKWGLNEYRMHCRDRYDAGAHGRSLNLGWPIPAKPPIPSSEAAPLHRGPPRALARNCARKASRTPCAVKATARTQRVLAAAAAAVRSATSAPPAPLHAKHAPLPVRRTESRATVPCHAPARSGPHWHEPQLSAALHLLPAIPRSTPSLLAACVHPASPAATTMASPTSARGPRCPAPALPQRRVGRAGRGYACVIEPGWPERTKAVVDAALIRTWRLDGRSALTCTRTSCPRSGRT